jgi:hypothetical protein
MARPSKFNPDRGQTIIKVLAEGGGRDCAAMVAKVGLRTLAEWLAKGRAGDPTFAEWARRAEAAEQAARARYFAWKYEREAERAKESYQRYKAARVQWWRDQLGEVGFWRQRVAWLVANGKTRKLRTAVLQLQVALERARRAEGFRTKATP